jgi:signal transduction histidine kinase
MSEGPIALQARKRQTPAANRDRIMRIERLNALARFSACLIHEINNPLAGALLCADLLRKNLESGKADDERTLECLRRIESELTRVSRLIKSLKDFAQESALDLKEFDLADLIDQTLAEFASALGSAGIKTILNIAKPLPWVKGDRERLQEVLSNLVANAVRAMPEGGCLSLRAWAKPGFVGLSVGDNGVGIAESDLPKLFIPFFSTKAEVKNVGLGLAAAFGILQAHGGSLEVQSCRGRGSTFILELPALDLSV